MYDCGPARRIQNRRQSAHEALQQLHSRSGDGLIRADHVRGQKVHALRRKMGPHSGQMMLRGNQQNPGEALMSALLQSIANDMKSITKNDPMRFQIVHSPDIRRREGTGMGCPQSAIAKLEL